MRGLVINRFQGAAILLDGGHFLGEDSHNVIAGNFIGTDVTGSVALANMTAPFQAASPGANAGGGALSIFSNSNEIGGLLPGDRNLISGNYGDGVWIANSYQNNQIQGNLIGTAATGVTALGNGSGGIEDRGGLGTLVGGPSAAERNVISGNNNTTINVHGNEGAGIFMTGSSSIIQGNYVGTDVTGTQRLGNADVGVLVAGTSQVLIGGTNPGDGNLISANGYGIRAGQNISLTIQGNLIGTDWIGTIAVGNSEGIFSGSGGDLNVPANIMIGGTTSGAGNLISGNNIGIDLRGPGHTIQGNLIGVDITGTHVLGADVRLGCCGGNAVYLADAAADNIIGGTTQGSGNVIGYGGLALHGPNVVGNIIQGNFIGTDTTGTQPVSNSGIGLSNYASNNTIGGTSAGAGNVIAFNSNGQEGVFIDSGTGNSILGNSIHDNGALGIRLNTANNANDNQAAPVLTGLGGSAASPTLSGTLTSTANTTFRIEFFSNQGLDASGHAEGQTFLGSTYVTTGANGTTTFTATGLAAIPATQGYLTATATVATATNSGYSYGDTSQFSPYLYVAYFFGGFLPPLSSGLTFALNRTIPVKFQLTDLSGNPVTSLSAVTSLQVAPVVGGVAGTPFAPASTNNQGLQSTGGQYLFTWQTKGLAAGTYEILLTLADGTVQTKVLTLRAPGSAGAQVANGSTTTTTTGALLGGDIELYVDNSSGLFTSDELARINDAVAAVDATLAPYGVTITEVTDSSVANVTLDTGSTSAVGGYIDGVLGCWNPAGEITLIQGWNWYAGSDPTQIGAGQYDFQTTVTHELGHALGLGESSDPTSAMYASLATVTVIRNLTTADLAIPYTGTGADAVHAAVPPVLASVTLERTQLEPGTINFFASGAAARSSNTAAALLASPQDGVAARLGTLGAKHQDQDSGFGLAAPVPLEGRHSGTGGGDNGILPVEEAADEEAPEGLPPQLDTGAAPTVAPAAPGASAVEALSPAARWQSALDAYFADERWTEAGNNGSATVPWVAAEDTDPACLRVQSAGTPAIAAATLAVVLGGYVAQPTERERRTPRRFLLK